MKLSDLAFKYKTDKGNIPFDKKTHLHNYVSIYEKIFDPIRENALNIVDIGAVGSNGGGSTKMWREYFPNSNIYAIDINPDVLNIRLNNVYTINLDLDDEAAVISTLNNLNVKFDIVIEDGSHHPRQQMRTLFNFSNYLNKNYHYFIEDLCAGENTDIPDGLKKSKLPFLSDLEMEHIKTKVYKIVIHNTNIGSFVLHAT